MNLGKFEKLKVNPDWAKLPLFDRKGSRRLAFGEFAQSVNDRVEPSDAADEPYVGLDDLDSGSLHIRRWGKGSDVIGTKLRFRKGDIIFGRRRAYQRKLAVANFDGICSAHAMVVRAKQEFVLPDFLLFLMMSDRFMERAVEISVGSLSPTINWKTLKLEEFVLPLLDQQRRLAEVLSAVDDIGERLERSALACKDAVDTRLSVAFGNAASGRGPAVVTKLLREIAYIQTGIAKGKTYSTNVQTVEMPYLRVANVQDTRLDLTEIKTIVIPVAEKRRFMLQEGDVVICEGGDFDQVGRGAIWRGQISECLHQNHVFALRADPSVLDPEFLALQLGSSYGKRYFLSCAKKTSNLASINSTQVKAFPFQLPALPTQRRFVSEIGELRSMHVAVDGNLTAAKRFLVELTKSFA